MAAIDVFQTVAPDLAEDPLIAAFIGYAQQEVDAKVWGHKTDRGVAYLAAHMLTEARRGTIGPGGMLVSDKVGDLSQTFSHATYRQDEQLYATTTYGVSFIRLRRTLRFGPMLLS